MYGAIDPRFADLRVQLRRDLLRKVAVEVVKTLKTPREGLQFRSTSIRLNCDAAGNILVVNNKRFRTFATSSFPTKLLKDAP